MASRTSCSWSGVRGIRREPVVHREPGQPGLGQRTEQRRDVGDPIAGFPSAAVDEQHGHMRPGARRNPRVEGHPRCGVVDQALVQAGPEHVAHRLRLEGERPRGARGRAHAAATPPGAACSATATAASSRRGEWRRPRRRARRRLRRPTMRSQNSRTCPTGTSVSAPPCTDQRRHARQSASRGHTRRQPARPRARRRRSSPGRPAARRRPRRAARGGRRRCEAPSRDR